MQHFIGNRLLGIFTHGNSYFLWAIILILLLSACGTTNPTKPAVDLKNADEIPEDFDFSTMTSVDLTISAEDAFGVPIAQAYFEVFHSFNLTSANPTDGVRVLSGATDTKGKFEANVEVPSYVDKLLVYLAYVGLPTSAIVEIGEDKKIDVHFAPITSSRDLRSDVSFDAGMKPLQNQEGLEPQATSYSFLGTFDDQGVPQYLTTPDTISEHILNLVNNSVPERTSLTISHPNYVAQSAESNIELKDPSEISVTFVHEGTGYTNTIGYYYYNKASPPAERGDINNFTVIFPNSSFRSSGGGLTPGDRVKLKYKPGTAQESTIFPAGTVVSWFLVTNGWNGSSVGNGFNMHLSDPTLNTEKNPNLRRHTAFLYDDVEQAFILGFEDINRELQACDNDFNDAVLKVKLSSVTAMDLADVAEADKAKPADSDRDGISDLYDNYPTDPSMAFNNFYPSNNDYGTLVFEDQWPLKGDYDFNDLVVGYRVNHITNAQNKVVELQGSYRFQAAGASYTNAFAFELPIAPSKVKSVTGQWFAGSGDNTYQPGSSWIYLDLNPNGTEKAQDKAVIFVIDDTSTFLGRIVNTGEGEEVAARIRDITVRFTEPQDLNTLGQPPYHPFIVTDIYRGLAPACDCQERGTEVHLAGHAPTTLAEKSLFNTKDDASDLARNRTYRTSNNLPWALHIPTQFVYPKEHLQITEGHAHFIDWAYSGGSSKADWYLDKIGYRNPNKLFDVSKLPADTIVD